MAARIVDALSHPSARGKVDGKREDDTTSRWLVQKRTYFKGSYDRVLTVSTSAIGTQMPNLQGTNLYSIAPEFNIKSVTFEKDVLTVNAKPDAKKGLEKWTVHSSYLPELATSMYESFAVNAKNVSKNKETQIQLVDECFAAFKLKKGKWVPCTLRVTNTAVERLDNMLTVLWRARFVDMKSPGIVLLDDTVRGAKAFKVCAAGDRGQRIFCAVNRDNLTKLLQATAVTSLGLQVSVAPSAGTAAQHAEARDGAHIEQCSTAGCTPLHDFWVSRVKLPAEFWAGGKTSEGSEDGMGRFGGYQRRARLLSLTETCLIEKGSDAKRISRLHDLSGVAALVCFELACESRYFAIEWADGSLPGVYESNRRQRDLALLLEQTQVAAGRCVPVLADFTWLCRKIIGKTAGPQPLPCPALAADPELEAHLFDQLQNAAAAVHDTVCEERIIAYEAAVAAMPKVVSLAVVPDAPTIGEALPELPPMRRPVAADDIRLEEIAEDTAAAAKAHFQRAKIVAGQVAANAKVQAIKLANAVKYQAAVTKDAVESSETYKKMGQAVHDVVHGAVGDINVPEKHAFLFERIMEFNASVPYTGFSAAFLEQMNRPGRFDKDARRKAYITLEALFCLLPEAKKEGQRRLRPDARTAGFLIATLQALQRLVSCSQLQEEVCALKLFPVLFSLLECGCERVSMEAARLLTRLWAPEAFLNGAKPFVNKTTGEEYHLNKPEDAIQVRANKGSCFDSDNCFAHVEALVAGLIASSGNELLCVTLVEATAALVAEPECRNTPDVVQKMVKELLSKQGKEVFRLMNNPCARASAGVMAVVRETLSISAEAATPLRTAALDEGIIVKHLLLALQPLSVKGQADSASVARVNKVVASREFVQRLVEQHAATQSLMQRIFPSMLLSLLRKPPTEPDASPGPNWPLFWRAASVENHHLAGLIWDESTRYQLRTSLEQENKVLADARRAGKAPRWNHVEFHVPYPPPRKILKIGDVHVNYLLDNANDPHAVDSLQEPRAFFDKLYLHLVYALAGVRPSTLHETDSNDPRYEIEMCLRAMAAVYDTHAHHVGPCKGVPYLVSMLDRADSTTVRERLVSLIVALVSPKAAFAGEASSGGSSRPGDASARSMSSTGGGTPKAGNAANANASAAQSAARAANAAKANGREIMAAGGVRLLVELASMAHLQSQAISLGGGGPALLMDHAQADMDAVASWWYYEGEAPRAAPTAAEGRSSPELGERPPGDGEPGCMGPFSSRALLALVRDGTISRDHPVWAPGMSNPLEVSAVRQLRWMLATGASGAKWTMLAHSCMAAVRGLIEQAPTSDDAEAEPVVPLPNIIRHVSAPQCLPHIAQLLLTQDPQLVRDACAVLLHVAHSHRQVLHRLYVTGVFFFALAYVGRDLLPIAALLQATHNEQHFQGVQDPALRASLPVGERSILGSLLPESLLYQLETHGARAFAEQMTRHMDDPEVLWSQSMREEELLPAVHAHLAAFPLRLRDNVLGLYDYTPMPPMTYKALKGELWCWRYYLRKLCSPEHLSHNIVDAIRFRNEMVAEWNREMERKAADFTQSDALHAMAIPPADVEGVDAEGMLALLKKAYRKQALKLHPDKNPDGPEPFLKMQRAYQALIAEAQGEAEIGGGPRPQRLSLLLRAQCLLHRREPDTLGEFTFPAYDPLLSLLNTSVSENLAGEHVMLCLELMWLTLNACPGNAPFLGDKGAVPVLVNLLMAARQQMAQDTVAHVDHAVIVTLSLRALALVLGSEETRREVVMMPDDDRTEFLKVLCWCASLPRATNVAAAALGALTACAAAPALQAQLLEMAVLATVFTRMLQYNATEGPQEDIDIAELRGGVAAGDTTARSSLSAKQRAAHEVIAAPPSDNLIAAKAAATLCALCGLAEGNAPLPDVQALLVQTAARALLTPYLYAHLQRPHDHQELLSVLTGERSSPLVVWSGGMRRQLRRVIDDHARSAPITHDMLRTLGAFKYDEVAEEMVVEDVYVRLFVEDPTFSELQHKALSLFSGLAVHLHMAICHDTSSLDKSLRPSSYCTFEATPAAGDAAASLRIPHLYTAFDAVHALAVSPTYSSDLHSAMATPAVLAPLICWIMKPCIDADRDAAAVNDAFAAAATPEATALTHACAETSLKMIEAGSRIPEVKGELCGVGDERSTAQICKAITHALFCTLHSPCTRSAQRSALLVLATLLDTTEPTRVAVEDGGYVLLLDMIFSRAPAGMSGAELEEDMAVRALTVKAMCTLLEHKSALQVRIERTILQLVPEAMLEKIRSCPEGKEVIERSIDVPVDTPELVWTTEMHDRTCDKLGALASDVRTCMVSGTNWKLQSTDTIVHEELQYDLFVGGVYLRRFLDTGKSTSSTDLSDPRAFLDGVMLELNACTDAALEAAARPHTATETPEGTASNHDLALMLGRAAELALGRYPGLPAHATQQGYVEWLVARSPRFGESEELQNVGGVLLRVLLQLSLNPLSAQRLAAPTPALIPCAQACTPWNLAAAVFMLDIVRCALHDSNPDRDEVIHQCVVHGFVLQLLGLLEPEVEGLSAALVPPHYIARTSAEANAAVKADSDIVRNLAVEIMHKLVQSDAYGEQIQEVLGEYEAVWRKHQRHSGMIRSDASAARAAPAANLLRGPTSTTQFALPPPPSKEVLLIKSTAAVREEAEEAKRAMMSSLGSPNRSPNPSPRLAANSAAAAVPPVPQAATLRTPTAATPATPPAAPAKQEAFDPFAASSAAAPSPPAPTAAAGPPSLSSILTSQSQAKSAAGGVVDPLAGGAAADPFAASNTVSSPVHARPAGTPGGGNRTNANGVPAAPKPQDPFAADPFVSSAPPTTNGHAAEPAQEIIDMDYDPLA